MLRRRTLLASLPALAWAPPLRAHARRVVALGGTATEIVDALGAFHRLVGVDASSLYPARARDLPQVGYYRNFSVEGMASLHPDLVLASEHAGPSRSLNQLKALGMPVVRVPAAPTLAALHEAILIVAQALDLHAQGQALAERVRDEVGRARADTNDGAPRPRVLVLSRHTGRLQAAGSGTAAHAIVTLAGADNLFAERAGYKDISAEVIVSLAPRAIVTTTMSVRDDRSSAAFAARPGVASTPAAREGRIVVVDDLLLLGFGPRVGQAVQQLRPVFDKAVATSPGRRG